MADLSDDEWEALCDGCGKCCLHKLEDEDTREILFTSVACRLLDIDRCRCTRYATRRREVPDCLDIREALHHPHWLPETCAYRLIAGGLPLPAWHPLVSARTDSVHRAGISIRSYAIPEQQAEHLEEHVIEWLR
jgi:uncharacterized cysteine cluster protein YcgN (CxxCxxCC family)